MSMRDALRRVGATSFHVMAATASLAFLQWVVMADIARVDGPASLGRYALAQAYATAVGYLGWLSLRQQLIIARTDRADAADFAFLRIVAPAIVFPPTLLLVVVAYRDPDLTLITALVLLNKYVEGFFDLSYGRMQGSGDAAGLSRTAFTRSLATVVAFLVSYHASRSLPVGLLVMTAVSAVTYPLQSRRFPPFPFERSSVSFSRKHLGHRAAIATFLLPLALSGVLMAAVTNAPRVFLERLAGPEELGYFVAVFHFVLIGAIVVASLTHALLPLLARAAADGRARAFWTALLAPVAAVAAVCFLGAAVAGLVGSQLVRVVYGPEFAGLGRLLVLGALTAIPLYAGSMIAAGLYAVQLRGALLWAQGAGLAAFVVAAPRAIGTFGVEGAFLVTAAASVVQIVVCLWALVSTRLGAA